MRQVKQCTPYCTGCPHKSQPQPPASEQPLPAAALQCWPQPCIESPGYMHSLVPDSSITCPKQLTALCAHAELQSTSRQHRTHQPAHEPQRNPVIPGAGPCVLLPCCPVHSPATRSTHQTPAFPFIPRAMRALPPIAHIARSAWFRIPFGDPGPIPQRAAVSGDLISTALHTLRLTAAAAGPPALLPPPPPPAGSHQARWPLPQQPWQQPEPQG
jgi:hypothetical protein